MTDVGITALYHQLVDRHLPRQQPHGLPLRSDKPRRKRQLFSTIYDILLFRSRQLSKNSSEPNLNEVNQLLSHVFRFRWNRQFDKASELENLLDKIKPTVNNDGSVRAMMALILRLAGTGHDVYSENTMPVVCHSSKSKVLLPEGPLGYGDTRVLLTDSMYYTMYDKDSFMPKMINSKLDISANVLKSLPGIGVSKFFAHEENQQNRTNSRTLFGALVECKASVVSPCTKLDLPSMEDTGLRIRVPCLSPTLTDEGRQTGNESLTSTVTEESDPTQIWEDALALPSRKGAQNWENVELRPYITELGREALNHLYWYHQDLLATVDPEFVPVRQLYVTMSYLQRDVKYLLLGMSSKIFMLDPTDRKFRIRPGICLSGTTPEAFSSLMNPFLECGSLFYRLTLFSKPPTLNSFYMKGLVFQAFATAVRKYLRVYESFVLKLNEDSIHKLQNRCHHLIKQVRFLAQICQISFHDNKKDEFPTGLRLLSYLYQHALSSCGSVNYSVLLSFLKTAAVPYVNFIQKWVYHGVSHDPYEEFMIKVNNDFLYCRDKYYWTQGYELTKMDLDSTISSLFLNEIMPEIYNCGRAINLLKLCCPDHFLCNIGVNEVPRLSVTYDMEELERIKVNTTVYVSRVEQITRRSMISRKEILERQERARFDLIQKGRQAAMEHMEQARLEKQKIRSAIQDKKRKQLQELKIEMEKDQDRKQELIEQRKAEDKAYMESLKNQDAKPKSDLELRLEDQVKEELIRQYERMTVEALLRERKALWRVERAKLTLERNSMLQKEEMELKEEYAEYLAKKREEMKNEKVLKEIGNLDVVDTVQKDGVSDNYTADDDVTRALNVIRQTDVTVSVSDVTIDNLLDITSLTSSLSNDVIPLSKNILDMTVPDVGPGSLLDGPVPAWAQQTETKTVSGAWGTDTSQNNQEMPIWAQQGLVNPDTVVVQSDDGKIDPEANNDNEENADEKSSAVPEVRVEPAQPIRTAIEESTQSERKSSTRSVSGRHIGQTNFSFRDMAPEPYEFTLPNLRPIDEILNDTASVDTSFEICRRTSFYSSPVKTAPAKQKNETIENENETDMRAKKFEQRNMHGSHPSQTTKEKVTSVPNNVSKITEQSTEQADTRIVRFRELNIHGHSSDSKLKIQDGSSDTAWTTEKQSAFSFDKNETGNTTPEITKPKHVSDETDQVDLAALRIRKFHLTNKAGHTTRSSKSSVQTLLYGENFGTIKSENPNDNSNPETDPTNETVREPSPLPWLDQGVEQYKDNYDEVYQNPIFDMAKRVYQTSSTYENADAEDTSAQTYISLPVLIKRSIVGPILAQISLTNRSLVTYFFQDLMIDRHFEALKLFMFLEDGEFGQTLGDVLFEKLAHDPLPHEVFNTVFLSGALIKALRASNVASGMSEFLLLGNKYLPRATDMNGPRALDCLDLHYQINWPMNIVITDSCLLRYNMIFCFMLQLKRVAWCLNDIWYRLKRDALTHFGSDLSQFRILQLHRHEMQNFVRVVQAYLSNQIIHVSWREFQQDLMNNVNTLDDLHDVHATYLNKAVFRCLLSKKAGSMMKVIQDILGLILKFHSQLLSAGWQKDGQIVAHPSFEGMQQTYRNFRDYSMFLFKVIRKVTARGYQPHLEELLLRLNFNAYYTNRQRLV